MPVTRLADRSRTNDEPRLEDNRDASQTIHYRGDVESVELVDEVDPDDLLDAIAFLGARPMPSAVATDEGPTPEPTCSVKRVGTLLM